MSDPELQRDELAAVLEARRELGEEYEPALVESFIQRLDHAIDVRVQAGLAERARSDANQAESLRGQVRLGVASIALGLPITAIAGGTGGVWGLIACRSGIAAVNIGYAVSRLRGHERPRG